MIIVLWLIIGAIAGYITSVITKSSYGKFESIMLGVIGAFVGGLTMNILNKPGITGFNIYSIIIAILGAMMLSLIGRHIHR